MTIDELAEMIRKSFIDMEARLVATMATKEELKEVRGEMAKKDDLDRLEKKADTMAYHHNLKTETVW